MNRYLRFVWAWFFIRGATVMTIVFGSIVGGFMAAHIIFAPSPVDTTTISIDDCKIVGTINKQDNIYKVKC